MFARTTAPRPARIVFWPRLSVRTLIKRLAEADAAYRRRAQLESMDDRMLRDMGLTRADVEHELRRPLTW